MSVECIVIFESEVSASESKLPRRQSVPVVCYHLYIAVIDSLWPGWFLRPSLAVCCADHLGSETVRLRTRDKATQSGLRDDVGGVLCSHASSVFSRLTTVTGEVPSIRKPSP